MINRTVTLDSGTRSLVVPVTIINDTTSENREDFLARLVLQNPNDRSQVIVSPDEATVTFHDDDSKTCAFDESVSKYIYIYLLPQLSLLDSLGLKLMLMRVLVRKMCVSECVKEHWRDQSL